MVDDLTKITKLISVEVENYPLLYDKKTTFYYNNKIREEAFEEIAHKVQSQLNVHLTSAEIKKRWECTRKYFAKAIHKGLDYYLSKELSYLIPHINKGKPLKPVESRSVNDIFNDEEDNELSLKDVLEINTGIRTHSKSSLELNMAKNNSKNKDIEKNEKEKSIKLSTKVIPPSDKQYQEKAQKIEELEKKNLEIAETAMVGIKNLLKSNTHDDYDDDDYLIGIKQSLLYIPEKYLLDCTHGILDIIDQYIPET